MKKTPTLWKSLTQTAVPSIALGALCTIGAFVIGIRTSGDVKPFGTSQAALRASLTGPAIAGDVDDNGVLDMNDAIAILEFSENLETPTVQQIRRGDTDGDYRLTIKDALRVLRGISLR